ncbi:LysR family transcriptional regulator [Roseinatronobacter bogoriensis]|uniref:LysR family transcriptional regulator n=1 Tax=Roseinatronobacter bogoriensis subsp. barguzinensis TaxID=441209 RepID=A0A2K8KJY7_9RHOB|nr:MULTISPECIES: LysR family transcriptional regulator [Rhodobaca]ATX66630.1 LysR family transcriptional regulator [Rhodobaca barguzinensis]MBB4207809.1 DNA-binding transcriptional LysR family regulator [Rhodobaca bogoriensis DSM 18756]TDW39885.1 DNA-binding transcriptional LysR family regulator [Rhodobaca barguzinensis]TDY70962.1 DNA-binding transcriptional LysR family regulator [Rhodobaca bogoriensis DSM 18756]
MKFEERHLAQLAAVVDVGGVTEAASMLGMSQPAVSRTLSNMEKRLGEPLFIPGRRPLTPTPIARQLAAHGKVILEASRKASQAVQSFQRGTKGVVKIGGVPFFMDAFISRMIGEFQTGFPDIRVDQSYGNVPELQAAIRTNQLDLAICPMALMQADDGFEFIEILPGRNVIACRAGHPLLRRRRHNPKDLLQFPWITPLPGSPLLADLHTILLSIGVSEIAIRYSGGSLLSVLNYLEETDALTVLPHSVIFAFRHSGKVRVLPVQIPQPARSLGIIHMKGGPSIPAAAKLSDHIHTKFKDLRHLILRHENSVVWGG